MAELQRPIVPRRLYRYRSLGRGEVALEREIDSILERQIYCAEFSQMNDPMEGFYQPSAVLREDQDYRDIVADILNRKSGVGIACFTETYEDVLMWTHYASNYGGICLSYSSRALLDGLPNTVKLVRVSYSDQPPLISQAQVRNTDNAAIEILSYKKYNWAYEREWRILAPSIGHVRTGRAQAIRRIYFGSRVSRPFRQRILSKIQGTSIKAYMMNVDGYDHTWEPVNEAARQHAGLSSSDVEA